MDVRAPWCQRMVADGNWHMRNRKSALHPHFLLKDFLCAEPSAREREYVASPAVFQAATVAAAQQLLCEFLRPQRTGIGGRGTSSCGGADTDGGGAAAGAICAGAEPGAPGGGSSGAAVA